MSTSPNALYTERFQVLLTPAMRTRIEAIAAERGVSAGHVMREALAEKLSRLEAKAARAEARAASRRG
jgi:hypothetical protein